MPAAGPSAAARSRGAGAALAAPGSCEALAEVVAHHVDVRLVHELAVAVVLPGDGDRLDAVLRQAGPAELGVLVQALAVEHEDAARERLRLVGALRVRAEPEEVALPHLLGDLAAEREPEAHL